MIHFLRIQDFALIKQLELELNPGLTVISGETGAGKSIILAAVGLLLGQRAAADLIRSGSASAQVEALFSLEPGSPAARSLENEGMADRLDHGEMVVKRVVNREGRNRVQVNGSLATGSLLAKVGPQMVNLCGQHSHQLLLRPEEHLNLLDGFAGAASLAGETRRAVDKVRELDAELDEVRKGLKERGMRKDYLQHVIAELTEAALDPAEEEALKSERRVLANAEKIGGLAQGAHQDLYGADEGSALEVLGRVRSQLSELNSLDPSLAPVAAQVDEAYYLIEDAAATVQDYITRMVFDPGRLDWVESRLSQIQRITRKFGGGVAETLEFLDQAQRELDGLDQGEERLEELRKERALALDAALAQAAKLSRERNKAAERLAREVEAQLGELGMAACRFKVEFSPPGSGALDTPQGPLSPRGLEQAAFHIAPNPGEGFSPLTRIASGGELSRILLALQTLVAYRRGAPALIFDEVDAGVGGATGAAVGRKLAELSKGGQVICITHLPQIAAWGDHHVSVRKETRGGRTATVLTPLDEEGRIDELARMLAGPESGDAAREHAVQMLEGAAKQKALPGLATANP